MAADIPGDADTNAARLLTKLSDDEFIRLSKAQVGTLVDAIKQDMRLLETRAPVVPATPTVPV